MLIDLFRNRTLFLFWFLRFHVMLIVDACAIMIACYFLKQLGEEWAKTKARRHRRISR